MAVNSIGDYLKASVCVHAGAYVGSPIATNLLDQIPKNAVSLIILFSLTKCVKGIMEFPLSFVPVESP